MTQKDKAIQHFIYLSEAFLPDLLPGQNSFYRLMLEKAYDEGQKHQIVEQMKEIKRLNQEYAVLRYAKWKVDQELEKINSNRKQKNI